MSPTLQSATRREMETRPRDGLTCQIGWIDQNGQSTYDLNHAIGRVRLPDRWYTVNGGERRIHMPATQWFPICACHAEQLRNLDMREWQFESWYGNDDKRYFLGYGLFNDERARA